jgi:tyrosine-specific transport protein
MYNLISGLLLADVAINIHESSECEVPSSFKDFVDTALQSETAGTLTAGASLVSNSCFLAYGIVHAGSLLGISFHGIGLDPNIGAGAFASMIAYFSLTHTNTGLEKIANVAVMVVFSSFAVLVVPSIADVSDPMGTLLASGEYPDDFGAALAAAVPLLLSSLVYQNIVPSITKLLDFDRTKSTIAIAVGSAIPMAMYLAWCFASLGGGLECATSSGAGAAAFTAFSVSALVGSCITAVMSLAEEYESIISRKVDDDDPCLVTNRFSTPAVAAAMLPSVAVALAYSNGGDLTGALHFNGAFITPFLYGLLPIILYNSVQRLNGGTEGHSLFWSRLPQVLLGAGTIGAVGQDIFQDLPSLRNLIA